MCLPKEDCDGSTQAKSFAYIQMTVVTIFLADPDAWHQLCAKYWIHPGGEDTNEVLLRAQKFGLSGHTRIPQPTQLSHLCATIKNPTHQSRAWAAGFDPDMFGAGNMQNHFCSMIYFGALWMSNCLIDATAHLCIPTCKPSAFCHASYMCLNVGWLLPFVVYH